MSRIISLLKSERSESVMSLIAVSISVVYCLWLLPLDFIRGTSLFWFFPIGTLPNAQHDMLTALSGYYAFVQGPWNFPLFDVSSLNIPDHANIIFLDSIPIVALVGRLIFRLTGVVVNLYGVWTALAIILLPEALVRLVRLLGARSLEAGLAATVFGLSSPPFIFRWGHLSLLAHAEVIWALILYFRVMNRKIGSIGFASSGAALLLLGLWTHSYLFLMISGVLGATLAQAVISRRFAAVSIASTVAIFAAVSFFGIIVSGHLRGTGTLAADGFGAYSMNLLSPIYPQLSGLFSPWNGDRTLVGDYLQYEGYNYFGAGGLLLIILLLTRTQKEVYPAILRRHAALLVVILACILLAISNIFVIANFTIISIPLPVFALNSLQIIRSSGRFFWPAFYLLTALAIAERGRQLGSEISVVLGVAALLQWSDAALLRHDFEQNINTVAAPPLELNSWRSLIALHQAVMVHPVFNCLGFKAYTSRMAAVELQLLATEVKVPINTVYAARVFPDCVIEAALGDAYSTPPDVLTVYLASHPRFEALAKTARGPVSPCAASADLILCSSKVPRQTLAGYLNVVQQYK